MVASVKKIMVEFQKMAAECKTRLGFAEGSWYGNWNIVVLLQDNTFKDVGFLENSIPGSFLLTIFDDGERYESGKNQCSIAQNYLPALAQSQKKHTKTPTCIFCLAGYKICISLQMFLQRGARC